MLYKTEQMYFLQVKSIYLEENEVSTHITDLNPNKHYVVCIITLNEDPDAIMINEEEIKFNATVYANTNTSTKIVEDIIAAILMRSPSSECTSFNTFRRPLNFKLRPNKGFNLNLILNRRMGLMVGCSLGFVVFFIMVSVLLYTKIKERKRIAKTEPAWSEMNDYHSMHSKDDILENSTAASTDNILLGMTKNRNLSLDLTK